MPDRVQIRKLRGRVIPCNGCKRRVKGCAIYRNAVINNRYSEYRKGSNILGYCDVWDPERITQ